MTVYGVISDEVLRKALLSINNNQEIEKASGAAIDRNKITSLNLEFLSTFHYLINSDQDIIKIQNLQFFSNLTHLKLNNNKLEKIEGLDKLNNLQFIGLLAVNYFA